MSNDSKQIVFHIEVNSEMKSHIKQDQCEPQIKNGAHKIKFSNCKRYLKEIPLKNRNVSISFHYKAQQSVI